MCMKVIKDNMDIFYTILSQIVTIALYIFWRAIILVESEW